ncbi:TraR/DksA family transcriptional regulator [Micromonospora sp. NBC_01655]|uniref:TraR/DksA C4-type zinc finger protein n=1 Tax=unclassified Micromonospora TaxID=2617518 RepID=UPI000FFF6274|nr:MULTISPECIES: TraR/DksA C4-type zinc finger protein [unclassified Micromonospora]MCX4472609.1 TraR/DksA family transcriptional regulator [Micromonospora sp. NBC_01655]
MVLEEQYARHHTQLALLARQGAQPDHPAADTDTTAALTAASRRALDDLARALRHLEQGRYGTCRRCRTDIPIEYLAHRPGARFCPRCDAASTRR